MGDDVAEVLAAISPWALDSGRIDVEPDEREEFVAGLARLLATARADRLAADHTPPSEAS